MSTQEKRTKMLSLVQDWKASGLTQKAFANLHSINTATLGYWIARSKEINATTNNFVEISPGTLPASDLVEIIYPTGVRIKAPWNLSIIARLIQL